MTSVIRTEKLTKSYGSHRGIVDVDLGIGQRHRAKGRNCGN